jgi:hypothetical protein
VPGAGIEPARPYGHKILSLAWLPITPPGQGVEYDRHIVRTLTHLKALRAYKCVSPGWESNPRMAVLQTAALTTSPPGLNL